MTTYRVVLIIALLFVVTGAAFGADAQNAPFDWVAFHRQNDRDWAARSTLSARDVRSLRRAAGSRDDEPSNAIEAVDAKTLPKGHILFVTATGSGHCLNVSVYRRRTGGFKKLWSASETPDGAGFCRPSLCSNPTAFATSKGEVVVVVPSQEGGDEVGVCGVNEVFTYRNTGKTYTLESQSKKAAHCKSDTYHAGLDLAFQVSDENRLLTVELLPSFQVESAIAFERTAKGITVTHIAFRKQLWSELGLLTKPLTASQCMRSAKSAELERVHIPLSTDEVRRLLDTLPPTAAVDQLSTRYTREMCLHARRTGLQDCAGGRTLDATN